MKPNNFLPIKCTEDSFYRLWIEFLAPFHKLTARERDVAARIVAQYFKLKESISDPAVLKEVLWSQTSRKDIRESLKMSPAHFNMVLAELKKAGVLIDGDLNKRYIPHKTEGTRFIFEIIFDWSSSEHPVNGTQ
jgi:hypothetical protein